ncbi:hypothetical protein [Lysobacter sp. CA199]|uniref:hypothetical protein n=1 Tax=Lysobacter sp. CA199 TaxID=3455608 RepID=UPI003F8D2798
MNTINKLAVALRELHDATYHMCDTSPRTGTRFPDASAAAREALAEYQRDVSGRIAKCAEQVETLRPDELHIEPLQSTQGADMALCTSEGVIAIIQHDPDIQTVDDPDFESVVWTAQDHANAQRLVDGWNAVAAVRAYDDAINAAERVPTADDYNEILSILGVA